MEKITKEELLEKLGGEALSDDELGKVSGGSYNDCYLHCHNDYPAEEFESCVSKCR